MNKQISLKSIIIVLVLIGALIGGYFGYKYLIKQNTVKTLNTITNQLGRMVKPVDGKCQILTISYMEGSEIKKEQVVNIACVKQPETTEAPAPNPFIEPTPEPTVEIVEPE